MSLRGGDMRSFLAALMTVGAGGPAFGTTLGTKGGPPPNITPLGRFSASTIISGNRSHGTEWLQPVAPAG